MSEDVRDDELRLLVLGPAPARALGKLLADINDYDLAVTIEVDVDSEAILIRIREKP